MERAPTTPAGGDAFLDRVEELARLDRVIAGVTTGRPLWLALVGPRKIGKTSLLTEWMASTRGTVRWATFDLFREPPGPHFWRRWVVRVADGALAPEVGASVGSAAVDPGRWRTLLLGSPSIRSLPVEVQGWLLGVPESSMSDSWLAMALELPETLARATGTPMVVVIDEFQELLEHRGQEHDIAHRLRGSWQHQRQVAYVISGSAQHTIQQLVEDDTSPFFGHFDLMRLGPLPVDAAAELLTRVAQRELAPDAWEAAWRVLGGHPFLLHALGDTLAGGRGTIVLSEVKRAVQSILFTSSGFLSLHFEHTWRELVGRAATVGAVVEVLSGGDTRLTDVSAATGLATGAVASTLRRLGEAVIKGPDGLYSLADPVFARWLQWRGPGGATVPMRVLGDEAELAVAEAIAQRGFQLVYQSRGSRGSFDLIGIRNGRVLGVQVKRRALPLTIKKAERERIDADAIELGIPWVLAAVEHGGAVHFVDPKRRKGATFDRSAAVENLPRWFDEGR